MLGSRAAQGVVNFLEAEVGGEFGGDGDDTPGDRSNFSMSGFEDGIAGAAQGGVHG